MPTINDDPSFDNMPLNEEALPPVDESELVFGAKLPPMWEGVYAVKASLGSKGKTFDATKKSYTIHAVNRIVRPIRVQNPNAPDKDVDLHKVFYDETGKGRQIHDFFRISSSNLMGQQKAVQFLKYAGDPEYNSYKTPGALAQAVEEALKQEPGDLKLAGRWEASVKVGVDKETGKDKYEAVRGFKKFPLREDGSRSHIATIDGEQVPGQFAVQEYGEVTQADVRAAEQLLAS